MRQFRTLGLLRAYAAGRTVAVLGANTHDVEALHAFLGEGVAHDSSTDPTMVVYTLRRVNRIPTARVLSHARLSSREAKVPEDDALTFTRAVDIVVSDLNPPPPAAVKGSQSCGSDGAACWSDNPVQETILTTNAAAGVFNTTVNVYALHDCTQGRDQYVVTAVADWTATQAKFQSASSDRGTLTVDSSGDAIVEEWSNDADSCSAGVAANDGSVSICRYINYPLQYEMAVVPPTTGTVLQLAAAPAATQGLATSYSSGISFNIGGTVNISGEGPEGGPGGRLLGQHNHGRGPGAAGESG